MSVVYYSSESTSPSLLSQMDSFGLDVLDYFLLDKLRIYPRQLTERYPDPAQLLSVLLHHMAALPPEFGAIILVANVGNEPPESRRGGVSLGDGHPWSTSI